MKSSPSLSIFFPAYNEELNIADSVSQAELAVKQLTNTYEIIIVNDGSRDETGALAEELSRNNPHIRVIHHPKNQGYGAAVWSGIQAARYDYVFFTDADLQFDLNELQLLWQHVPEYRAVLGFRAKRRDPFIRLVNAKGWNALVRLFFGLRVKDVDCAFKLLDRKLVARLPIRSRGAVMSAELLTHLQRQKVTFKEVPVTHLPRTQGAPTGAKVSVILLAFKELFQAYRGELGNPTHKQLIRFALVGIANTLIDIGLFLVLTRFVPYFSRIPITGRVVAKAVSFLTATLASFFMHRTWTFRRVNPVQASELLRFYVTSIGGLTLNTLTLYLLLRYTPLYDLAAVVIATLVSFVWNFSLSKVWVFRHSRERSLYAR